MTSISKDEINQTLIAYFDEIILDLPYSMFDTEIDRAIILKELPTIFDKVLSDWFEREKIKKNYKFEIIE